jgi:hypothetical protein
MKHSRSNKTRAPSRALLIVLSLAFVAVIVPHALEDFFYGEFTRLGVSQVLPRVILPATTVLTIYGALLVFFNRTPGGLLLSIIGLIWFLGDILIHGHDFLFAGPEYRHGFISRLLEALILVFGASLTVGGFQFWRAR